MNCSEAIEYIHSLERFGIMPGLERISALCEKLGNPQNNLKFIHVAGTNGKGSTCTICANILREAGYKVGLYTSPYVVDFRERIQINGEMIPENDLALCVSKVKETADEYNIKTTEFEFITAVAFLYFSRQNCDYVVLEVGLGGRFDATNVIPAPEASVIASISLDHTAVLGDTIEKIAFEKCGIIKPGSKVILYPKQKTEAFSVIKDACDKYGIIPVVPDLTLLETGSSDIHGTKASYKGMEFTLSLAGEHMTYNAVTAIETVKSILPDISDKAVTEGIVKSSMPARLELISDKPVVILDGGHNEDCALALEKYIIANLGDKKIRAVISIMADKDYVKYLESVLPHVESVIVCRADVPRALDADKLASEASKYCDDVTTIPDAVTAVKYALDDANDDEAVIVCGSFYFAGDVRETLIDYFKGGDGND
ncbi:MAG: bifunctional folylpolyglutamate synthase/dihydrofolate synthase [Clostridia bacterium]|nr:bifunctional folylpolyglutamate synthase/dihydrofolate synthase [Clostridia bacterium]